MRSLRLAFAFATMAHLPTGALALDLRLTLLDAGLVRQRAWTVAGAALDRPQLLGGGRAAAVVDDAGRPTLLLLDADGGHRATRLPALPGPVRAAHLTDDATLVVVAGDELLRLRVVDGHVLERRRVPPEAAEGQVAATARGAWLALPGRLLLARFDGRDAERPLPGPQGGQLARVWLLAMADGGCLVAEQRLAGHEVEGRPGNPDWTNDLALTRLDSRGEVRGGLVVGEVRSGREWFWREAGARDSLLPGPMGISRRRFFGWAGVEAMAERPGGGVALLLREGWEGDAVRRSLLLLGPELAVVARRERAGGPAVALAAVDAGGLLLAAEAGELWSGDDQARLAMAGRLGRWRDEVPGPARVAIGAAPAGGWLVVEY